MTTDASSAAALHTRMAERQQRLIDVAAQLKTELFGIDDVIDRVIDSLRAWYILPQCITRPVIVCLWGLTGTGKTQLTRRLAQLLGFYDRFVEVQMDASSRSDTRASSIAQILAHSSIDEGAPGILVLDEFQRFRTVAQMGQDAKLERYQDVWTLLSDGRLAPSLGVLQDIEMRLADAHYDDERKDEDGEPKRASQAPYRFQISAWEAGALRRLLKLREPLTHIMQWSPATVQQLFAQFRQSPQRWETDYSRLLIFVCGNLDEMYQETAQRVEDCDTDADIFHRVTRNLSLIDVKKSLTQRFKPEQIARLGNVHIIYPSLSRRTYERLIADVSQRYVNDIDAQTGVRFVIGADVHAALYANAVFPTQGTRPLFSSVHAILSATLVNAALWALQNKLDLTRGCELRLSPDRRFLVAIGVDAQGMSTTAQFAAAFDLDRLKTRTHADLRALLAVHEAGHALAYSLLFKQAPQEVKINIASFEGGYNNFAGRKATTRQNALDMICVALAGRAAEEWVFGTMACTTGAESDYQQATERAARYIRHHGFGKRLSRTDVTVEMDNHVNTDIAPSNDAIEALLRDQYARIQKLLRRQRQAFDAIVDALLHQGSITPPDMAALLQTCGITVTAHALDAGVDGAEPDGALMLEPFARRLAEFRASGGVMDRAG